MLAFGAVGFYASYKTARRAVKHIENKEPWKARKDTFLSFVGITASWVLIMFAAFS
jgi:hypothetical protein